jgi:competence protein ComEC
VEGGPRRHPGLLSWQVAFLAFVLGLMAPRFPWPALAGLGILWALHRLFTGRFFSPLILSLAFLSGGVWMAANLPDPAPEPPDFMLRRDKVRLSGVVDSLDPKSEGRVQVILDRVRVRLPSGEEESLPGRTVWNWEEPDFWPEPGQEIAAVFRVRPTRDFMNPGASDFEFSWRCRGVYWRVFSQGRPEGFTPGPAPGNALWAVRLALRRALLGGMGGGMDGGMAGGMEKPTPGAALILAQLMGDYSLLDAGTMDMMRRAGLTHTLALSGMNVAYVVFFGWLAAWGLSLAWPGLLLRLPRPKLTVAVSAPLVLAFLWIGQFSGSLLRATVMFGAFGLFLLFDRRQFLLDGLFAALAGILAFNPVALWDIGLQLSALCVAGLILFLPLARRLHADPQHVWARPVNALTDLAAMSLVANVSILPLQLWYFAELNPNFLINLPWLPLLGAVVMPLGLGGMFLAGLAAALPPDIAAFPAAWGGTLLQAAVWCQQRMLDGLAVVHGLDLLPAVSAWRPRWPEMLGYATALASLVALWMGRGPGRGEGVPESGGQGGRGERIGPCTGLGIGLALMLVPGLFEALDQRLTQARGGEVELALLDVGQGQCLLATAPDGSRHLFDCGGSGSRRFDIGRGVAAPFLLRGHLPRLAGVFLSHPDADHSQGLGFLLDRFRTGFFVFNGVWPTGAAAPDLAGITARRGVRVLVPREGEGLDLGGGLGAEVVQTAESTPAGEAQARPGRPNEESLVVRLTWRGRGLALIPGDLDQRGIRRLLASNAELSADLLVVPHHGSKGSLSPALYERVRPKAAAISCGYLNTYRFPAASVVQALAERGIPVLDTAASGQVRAVWRGAGEGGLSGPLLSTYNRGSWTQQIGP